MNRLTRLLTIGLIAATAALVPAHVAEAKTADPVVPSELVVPAGNSCSAWVTPSACRSTPATPRRAALPGCSSDRGPTSTTTAASSS